MSSLDKTYVEYFASHDSKCQVSISDVDEASRLLDAVFAAFDIDKDLQGKTVLDVGCGLGCVAEAFHRRGARVWALDSSPRAIENLQTSYPHITAVCASFGPEYRSTQKFDIVWNRDFFSTLEWDRFEAALVEPCLALLAPGGQLLLGLRSSFTGKVDETNWSNWTWEFIRRLRQDHGAEGPRVVQFRNRLLGWAALQWARLRGRRIPMYVRIRDRSGA